MRTIYLVGLVAVTGCYSEAAQESTLPAWGPAVVAGPPGGAVDPGYGYQASPPPTAEAPGQPGYPAGYPEGYPDGTAYAPDSVPDGVESQVAPPAGAADANVAIGTITDEQIDTTLAPYGQWVEDAEYGRVWRPYVTVVGVDFTPYETCGNWVYTEYGWTYQCDWDWGWLPFHYGQWAWC